MAIPDRLDPLKEAGIYGLGRLSVKLENLKLSRLFENGPIGTESR